jgi:DNA-binding transcriptional regulator YdaS (Cro superfamily)
MDQDTDIRTLDGRRLAVADLLELIAPSKKSVAAALGLSPTTLAHKLSGRNRYAITNADLEAVINLAGVRANALAQAIAEIQRDLDR